jgi:hypothetical protein
MAVQATTNNPLAFRKFYGRYNDLICPYNLSLGHMLSDMFYTNR